MKHIKNNHNDQLWFGMALGATAAASALYFLGTTRGRETLRRLIKTSEKLDEHLASSIKHFEIKNFDEVRDAIPRLEEKIIEVGKSSGLSSVIDKIKSFSDHAHPAKKFFVKD